MNSHSKTRRTFLAAALASLAASASFLSKRSFADTISPSPVATETDKPLVYSDNNSPSKNPRVDPYQERLVLVNFWGLCEEIWFNLLTMLDDGELPIKSVGGWWNFGFMNISDYSIDKQLNVASPESDFFNCGDQSSKYNGILLIITDNFYDPLKADHLEKCCGENFYGEKFCEARRFGAAVSKAGIKLRVVLVRSSIPNPRSITDGLLMQIENETKLEEPPIEIYISKGLELDDDEFYRETACRLWKTVRPICDQAAVLRDTC